MRAAMLAAAVALALRALCANAVAAQQTERSGGAALLIETAGATAGSGIALGLALFALETDECNNEDLGCILTKVFAAAAVSAVGAPAGDVIIGNRANTEPSLLGASFGSIAGVAAGFGVVHLISEELGLSRDDAVLFISYSVAHGFVTALGSRIARLLSS